MSSFAKALCFVSKSMQTDQEGTKTEPNSEQSQGEENKETDKKVRLG